MSFGMLVLVAIAGGIGAGIRHVLDRLLASRSRVFPVGILLINVTGSAVLGLVTGLGSALIPPDVLTVVGTGLLGGYTTFSTVSVETVLLAQRGRRRGALANLLGTLVLAVAGAGAGLVVGVSIASLAA